MRLIPLLDHEWHGAAGLAGRRRVVDQWLARGVIVFLILFVAASPHSVAITQIGYGAALFLWLLRYMLGGTSPLRQRLVWPLLVFLLLSAMSATLSSAPEASWPQMKKVALLLIAVLWAQNLTSPRQVKGFGVLLIASCLANVAYTGWQYTVGIGAKLAQIPPGSRLAKLGLQEGDCVSSVGRHRVRDRDQLLQALAAPDLELPAPLIVVRGAPGERIHLTLDRAARAGLRRGIAKGSVLVVRGHPLRAQGFFNHFVTYADVLLQIALLAFGLLATCPAAKVAKRVLLGLAVIVMVSALWLTLTRAAMVSFLIGCLLVVFLAYGWRMRLVTVALVVTAMLVGGLLLQRNRGLGWLDLNRPEAQYRLLMWRDGLRLIHEHPWLGVGMESLKLHWQEWQIEAYQKFPLQSHFHSSPVQIAVERGLLTLGAWVWLLAAYGRVLTRLLRITAKSDWVLRGLALGLASAACAFLLGSLTDYNWGDSEAVMIFWMFVGWGAALDRLLDRVPSASEYAPAEEELCLKPASAGPAQI